MITSFELYYIVSISSSVSLCLFTNYAVSDIILLMNYKEIAIWNIYLASITIIS